ncbi:MAG: hypothetical protein QXU12_04820 [Nitrososphaerota archaeon]
MSAELLERAVEEYNKFRSPEAVVRIIELRDDGFVAEFSGSFCLTCGVYDWLEDLRYEIRRLDPELDAVIDSWRQISDDSIIVEFKLIRKPAE